MVSQCSPFFSWGSDPTNKDVLSSKIIFYLFIHLGPGPAKYLLPTAIGRTGHDPRKNVAPGYSLAAGLDRNPRNKNPGPNHYRVDVQMTRAGKDGTPKYSLAQR